MKRQPDYALAVIKAITGLISADLYFIKMDPLCRETGRRAPFRARQTIQALNKHGTLFLLCTQWRTATSSKPHTCVASFLPATSRSSALDIPTTDNLLLMPAMGIYKIPTGIKGPIPKGSVGLLLGCSSLTSKGVQDLMGIIGEDYEGEISIMMKTEYPYQIIKGDCIAQLLLLLPYITTSKSHIKRTRGFGSTGKWVYWQTFVSDSRPTLYVCTNNKQLSGLVDTGADVSIISEKHWPISWPLTDVPIMLTGIGIMQNIQKSTNILTFSGSKKQPATLQSLIADIPTNLWGRDLLMQWGAYVTMPTYPVKLNKL